MGRHMEGHATYGLDAVLDVDRLIIGSETAFCLRLRILVQSSTPDLAYYVLRTRDISRVAHDHTHRDNRHYPPPY